MPIDRGGISYTCYPSENLVICELHLNEFEGKTGKTQLEKVISLQ